MVNAEKAITLFEKYINDYVPCCSTDDYDLDLFKAILELLEAWKPKNGEWIEKEDYDGDTYYDCSVCGESWTTIDGTPWQNGMNYCPHCGAKMGT